MDLNDNLLLANSKKHRLILFCENICMAQLPNIQIFKRRLVDVFLFDKTVGF